MLDKPVKPWKMVIGVPTTEKSRVAFLRYVTFSIYEKLKSSDVDEKSQLCG